MVARYVSIGVRWCVLAALASATLPFTVSAQSTPQTERIGVASRAATLLVFPFENSSRVARLDWLGEGLAELTAERLTGPGPFVFPREERLAALDRLGLPASTRFSRATMLKVAEEIDADGVLFGSYALEDKKLTLTARVLRLSPASLSPPVEESGALDDLMDTHARLTRRVLHFLDPAGGGASSSSPADFADRWPRLRLDAFEYYVRGLMSLDDEQRLRDFREAARLEPAWDAPAFALGQAYFARRDCESALPWLSRVPPAHGRGVEANFEAGVCHLLRNDAARAEAAFAGLLERSRPAEPAADARAEASTRPWELPEALNNLALVRERLGKMREAAAALERATQLDPEETEYWFNLGLLHVRANDPAAAVRPFREVLRRQPKDGEARALLIAALEKSGRASEVAAERQESAAAGSGGASLPAVSPVALARLDRIKTRLDPGSLHPQPESLTPEAAPRPGETLAHRLRHREFHMSRARDFLAAGKLNDAEREFSEAIVLAPLNSPAAHQGLAEVYRRQGRSDDALRELRAALASRDDPAARTALARLLMEQNRPAEAREELRAALKLNPAYPEARQLLEQLEERTGTGAPR